MCLFVWLVGFRFWVCFVVFVVVLKKQSASCGRGEEELRTWVAGSHRALSDSVRHFISVLQETLERGGECQHVQVRSGKGKVKGKAERN